MILLWSSTIAADLGELQRQFAETPRRKALWQPLVEAYEKQGDKDKALATLRKILKMDPVHPFSMGRHAYLLLTWEQRQEEAMEAARKTLNYFKSNIHALHTLAWAYYLRKDYASAWRTLREIRDKGLRDAQLQYHWALIAWKHGKFDAAKVHFRQARELNPDSRQLSISRGLFEEDRQRPSVAAGHYTQALKNTPEDGPLREFLLNRLRSIVPLRKKIPKQTSTEIASAPRIQRETEATQSHSQPSIPKTSTPTSPNPFFLPLGNTLVRQKKPLNRPLKQDQFHTLAEDMLRFKLGEDARMELAAAVAIEPSNAIASSARTLMNEAAELPRLPLDQRINNLLALTKNKVEQKAFRLSLYILEKTRLLDPQHPIVLKNLAWLHLKLRHPLSALPILETLYNRHPDFEEAKILYGYCLSSLRRFSKAAEVLTKALQTTQMRRFSREYTRGLLERIRDYSAPAPFLKESERP